MKLACLGARCALLLSLGFAPGARLSAQTHVVGYIGGGRFDTRLLEESFVGISAGHSFTLFHRADGSIAGVGANHSRQLELPAPPPGQSYVDIACGSGFSMALRSDGELVIAAGLFNDLRNVPPLPPGVSFVAVDGGLEHVVALRSDGELESWRDGIADYGQTQVPPLPPGVTYVEASAGARHSLARRSDGVVVGFGDNAAGQCNVPVLAAGLSWSALAAGGDLSVGLVSDGTLRIWGQSVFSASAPPGSVFTAIDAGQAPLALTSDGRAFTWNPFNFVLRELIPPAGRHVVQIAAGNNHSVGLLDDGHAIFDGDLRSAENNAPLAPPGVTYRRKNRGAFAYATFLLLGDGSLLAAGSNFHGEGNVPPLTGGLVYTQVAAAPSHTVALRNDGTVVNFGQYFGGLPRPPAGHGYVELAAGGEAVLGLLDDGRVLGYLSAVPALPPGESYTAIAAGMYHELALRSDGRLIAWGRNEEGQCDVPLLPAGVRYVQVDGGQLHTLALRSDGAIEAFGYNAYGQCDVPVLPPGLTYVEVAAGAFSGIARRSDGSFVTWGSNASGGNDLPDLAPDETILEFDGDGTFVIGRTVPSGAPDLVRTVPEIVPILSPGTTQDLVVLGTGFSALTTLTFDGVPVDPARYTVVNDGMLTLDLPQVAALGAHDLVASDGVNEDLLQLTVAATLGPKLEFESGDPLVPVDRDDGITFRLSGPVGSQHQVYLSPSNVPSVAPYVVFDLGNQFTQIVRGPRYVIPPQGIVEVFVPTSMLPVPPAAGLSFYSQTLMLRPPLPFRASPLQSFVLLP